MKTIIILFCQNTLIDGIIIFTTSMSFSYIKSVENYKLVLLNDLRNVKNELRFYRAIDQPKIPGGQVDKIKRLYNRKNSILTEFLELNKGFMLIDAMFQQEIKNINIRKKYWVVF